MHELVKDTIIFLVGGAIGYFIGYKRAEKKWKKKAEDEISDMEHYYKEKYPDPEPAKETKTDKVMTADDGIVPVTANVKFDKPDPTDYTQYYPENQTDPAEAEHPQDDETEDEENHYDGLEMTENAKKNRKRPPKMISGDDYGNEPGFAELSLLYYQGNDILTLDEDENGEDIIYFDEIESYIGDALHKFGFADNQEKTIYVRNYQRMADYMITKVFGSFEG